MLNSRLSKMQTCRLHFHLPLPFTLFILFLLSDTSDIKLGNSSRTQVNIGLDFNLQLLGRTSMSIESTFVITNIYLYGTILSSLDFKQCQKILTVLEKGVR